MTPARPTMLLLVVAASTLASATAARADREKAAEHFALAEAAEKRSDWRTAIAEYERAYAESPHPTVLFNIGLNYSHLGEGRSAAHYFQRYLRETPDAPDRAKVEARIATLRQKPSRVEVIANPVGATVFVDGQSEGSAPLTITLAPGRHEVFIAHAGRRSRPRAVDAEFGDPVTVDIDLEVLPGRLSVFADQTGADVRVDGQLIGHTPYQGVVPAGIHKVLVSKLGYQAIERSVTVSAGGSQQVRVRLAAYGAPGADPEQPPPRRKFVIGTGYGFDASGGDGLRYLVMLGYRPASDRWDVAFVFGALGGGIGGSVGGDARLYFATGRLRPYARVGLLAGTGSTSSSDKITLFEAGGGLLVMGTRLGPKRRAAYHLDYFVEVNASIRLQDPPMDQSRYAVPIVGGLLFRFGG